MCPKGDDPVTTGQNARGVSLDITTSDGRRKQALHKASSHPMQLPVTMYCCRCRDVAGSAMEGVVRLTFELFTTELTIGTTISA
jgi:hypothetical protein